MLTASLGACLPGDPVLRPSPSQQQVQACPPCSPCPPSTQLLLSFDAPGGSGPAAGFLPASAAGWAGHVPSCPLLFLPPLLPSFLIPDPLLGMLAELAAIASSYQ